MSNADDGEKPVQSPAITKSVIGGESEASSIATSLRNGISDLGKTELSATATGVSATTMAPEAAAGVRLSKYVLAIVAATILLLLVQLFWVGYDSRNDIAKAYDQVYLQVLNGTSAIDTTRLDAMVVALETGAKGTSAAPDALASDMRLMTASLLAAKLATERQRMVLDGCVPFPDVQRSERLGDCVDLLRTIKAASLAAGSNFDKIRVLTEFAKTVDEQQRGYQAFWLQVAQLLLLNLLLPLLTGLFGYIFGTQGARRSGP